MRKILLIGAGRSSFALVDYLLSNAEKENWQLHITDIEIGILNKMFGDHPALTTSAIDIRTKNAINDLIAQSDLVISMVPAHMHATVAAYCIAKRKHMVTASYISKEMKALDDDAKKAGVIIMNEIGVDPGIDHLSAMKEIDQIRNSGGEIQLFESFTGGLLAPESEGKNPWKYKFTWNPRNVVLAGRGTPVMFIQENKYKYIPYHRLFRRTEKIDIENYGRFEGYANRDSLKYRSIYGLTDIPTIYRGTLRRPGFGSAWDAFVQIGCTDDSYILKGSEEMSNRDFINSFLAYNPHDSVELKLMHYLKLDQDSDVIEKLKWLDIFDANQKPGLKNATPAQMLECILMKKWKLTPDDRDMIVMWHKFGYKINNELHGREAFMVLEGNEPPYTAMAKSVGYPVAIAAKMILNGVIKTEGIQLPVTKDIYQPILDELKTLGIAFRIKETEYNGY